MGPITFSQEEARLMIASAIAARDEEWNRVLGIEGTVLSPEDAAKWLEKDRASRARNVASESRFREVKHY